MTQLTLIRGLPGSTKSTLAKILCNTFNYWADKQENSMHLEADQYFIDDAGNYNFDATLLHKAHMWCQETAMRSLAAGKMVIVSNTFTTKKELKPYFEMIQQYGKNPIVFLAQSQFKNVHGVPDEVLKKMKERFVYDISDMFI